MAEGSEWLRVDTAFTPSITIREVTDQGDTATFRADDGSGLKLGSLLTVTRDGVRRTFTVVSVATPPMEDPFGPWTFTVAEVSRETVDLPSALRSFRDDL